MRNVTNLAALLRVDFPSNITFMQPEKYGLEKQSDLQRKGGVTNIDCIRTIGLLEEKRDVLRWELTLHCIVILNDFTS